MKKFLSFFAGALLLTACSNDDFTPAGVEGEEQQVTFSFELPNAMKSRAAAEYGATSAEGGVANLNGQELTFNVALYYIGNQTEANETAAWTGSAKGAEKVTFTPTLVIGKKYRIVAYASYNGAAWSDGAESENVLAEINNEAKDAYYCDTVETAASYMKAILYRPFGKVRVVTTDMAEALHQFNAEYIQDIKISYVQEVETVFNPLTGEFETKAAYEDNAEVNVYTEAEGQKTLTVDYLPAPADGSATMYNFTVDVTFDNGETFSREFSMDIPVKRNYVTTLIGDFFTSTAQLDVEVDNAFNGEEVKDMNLYYAFQDGGVFKLEQDYTVNETLTLAEGKTLSLDLNGHTITLATNNDGVVDEIVNNGTLNISNGSIVAASAEEENRRCVYNYGTMTIDNVEFVQLCETKGAAINNEGKMTIKDATVDAVYYSIWNSGAEAELVIEDGSYTTTNNVEVKNTWSYAVNNINGAKLTVNGGEFEGNHGVIACTTGAYATLNGGKFYCNAGYTGNSDWTLYADNGTILYSPECEISCDNPAGFKTTENGGIIAEMTADTADLATLVAVDGAMVYVTAGNYTLPTTFGKNVIVICEDGVVFTGTSNLNINGAVISGADFVNEGRFVTPQNGRFNGTFKDCTFKGGNVMNYGYTSGDVLFENCEFIGDQYATHFEGGGHNVTFKNCTISGFNTFGTGVKLLTFEGCTFKAANANSAYNGINLWGDTKLINCVFDFGKTSASEWINPVQSDKFNPTIEITNCTLGDGSTILSHKYFEVDVRSNNGTVTAIIDGVTYEGLVNYSFLACAEDMQWFANETNKKGNSFSGKTVKLTNDIDLAGIDWAPVGQTGGYSASTYFQGTFDGQGHTIKNLTVTKWEAGTDGGANYASGLFGFIDAAAADIKNVTVDGATVKGSHWCGVIAGYLSGVVENCHVKNAAVECTHANSEACGDKAGAVVGATNGTKGTVKNCTAANSTVKAGRDAGQVVGAAPASQVVDCSATNVTVSAIGDCTGANINNAVIGREL